MIDVVSPFEAVSCDVTQLFWIGKSSPHAAVSQADNQPSLLDRIVPRVSRTPDVAICHALQWVPVTPGQEPYSEYVAWVVDRALHYGGSLSPLRLELRSNR